MTNPNLYSERALGEAHLVNSTDSTLTDWLLDLQAHAPTFHSDTANALWATEVTWSPANAAGTAFLCSGVAFRRIRASRYPSS